MPCVADSYTWEERKVSWDGFVSYDGVRYGINWKLSGCTLRVKAHRGRILIADEHGEIIQEHGEVRSGRKYVYAAKQYEDFVELGAYAQPPSFGRQIEHTQVEVRPLTSYEHLVGGDAWSS